MTADARGDRVVRPNDVLRDRLRAKRLSERRFADEIGVSIKTVQRCLADRDHKIRPDSARRAAELLGCTPHDLWPAHYLAAGARVEPAPFAPTMYASRIHVPIGLWQKHFREAQESIDIMVYAATFLFDALDGFIDTLVDRANHGATVRLLIGDPDAAIMILRGEEEEIGTTVVARCRTTIELLAPRATTPGLQIRTHHTTLYTSNFRVDDDMIVNFHIYGSPGRNNPVMVFSRTDEPRLWSTLDQAFNRVWASAQPLA